MTIIPMILLTLMQASTLPDSLRDASFSPRIKVVKLDPVSFSASTPLAGNAELARRALTTLQGAQLPALLAARGARMADQPIDPAQEQFGEHLPPAPPASGRYGLFVFVPPWQTSAIPADWIPALDAAGMIIVTGARQGNPESPLGRREPMAILAAWNMMQRYPVDPARVFIAGFSGGSKVALKLALAYPDLFRGALLDAGAYPIGDAALPIPPADLFDRFRQSSRIVLIAGDHDTAREEQAAGSASLRSWCVANVTQHLVMGLGHEPVNRTDFTRALAALAAPPHSPSTSQESCWRRRLAERDAALAEVEKSSASGNVEATRRKLIALDRRYGGLAAPDSAAIAKSLPATPF